MLVFANPSLSQRAPYPELTLFYHPAHPSRGRQRGYSNIVCTATQHPGCGIGREPRGDRLPPHRTVPQHPAVLRPVSPIRNDLVAGQQQPCHLVPRQRRHARHCHRARLGHARTETVGARFYCILVLGVTRNLAKV